MTEHLTKEDLSGSRECPKCGRRWHGGYDHCCACVQDRIASLERDKARLEQEKDALQFERNELVIQRQDWKNSRASPPPQDARLREALQEAADALQRVSRLVVSGG